MKVFVSWSGQRSRYLAESLRNWLPRVIQSIRPWMSDEDIIAGSRWLNDISTELNDTKIGILCVTPENQANPWLVFEAGALSKTVEQPFVCPLLFDMSPGQLTGPLTQFQALSFDRNGLQRLLANLNGAPGHTQLPEGDLLEIFDVWWPKLESKLQTVPPNDENAVEKRSQEDLLEEILNNSREQLRRENLRIEHGKMRDEKVDQLLPMFEQMSVMAKRQVEGNRVLKEMLSQNLASLSLPVEASTQLPNISIDEQAVNGLDEMLRHMKGLTEASRAEREGLLSPPSQAKPADTNP
ncbi:TIR domain-containing protein [Burkholderia gladioli]|uniref:TIR domain-containing protein n=1 Tax=Burkholderia gladioli TaxID=28095 RepID=UPI001C2237EC|nr:TIR domain-containing protein [Burkholderia gladioli]MBU9166220.1 toll/interleukin-1 receptor domain-containing protein [Burkholderia gladioli]